MINYFGRHKHLMLCLICIFFSWILSTTSTALEAKNQKKSQSGRVIWVSDGDTIQIRGVGMVRLIGIDCPEKVISDRDWKYMKMGCKTQQCLRDNAQSTLNRVTKLCKEKQVQLEFGDESHDRYGRTLAYVWLPDGRMLNRLLLQEGRAMVYRRFNFSYKKNFIKIEKLARKHHLGLWAE